MKKLVSILLLSTLLVSTFSLNTKADTNKTQTEAETLYTISDEERLGLYDFFNTYGVTEDTQKQLITKLENNQSWDSFNIDLIDSAKLDIIDNGSLYKYTFPDGSIRVTSIPEVNSFKHNDISPRYIHTSNTRKLYGDSFSITYESTISDTIGIAGYTLLVTWTTSKYGTSINSWKQDRGYGLTPWTIQSNTSSLIRLEAYTTLQSANLFYWLEIKPGNGSLILTCNG